MAKKAKVKEYNVRCKKCGKIHNPNHKEKGNHVGSGQRLAKNILREKYGSIKQKNHPLSEPGGKNHTAEAHHLITSECLDDNDWPQICKNYSYNIDCFENGVILPAAMRIACELEIPLHRSSHADTESMITGETYINSVKLFIEDIKTNAKAKPNAYCDELKDIKKDMNEVSKEIWDHVYSFVFILTYDGHDYDNGGVGCLGHSSFESKKRKNRVDRTRFCINRKHADVKHQARMAKAKSHNFPERS